MPTHKKFFMYAVWVILFFIFSQVMIYVTIHTMYKEKTVEIQSSIIKEAEVKASSISGTAKIKLLNDTQDSISDKYIKMDCYSKRGVLMGSKYIKIDQLLTNEEKEFEIRFNYNKVNNVIIDIVDETPPEITLKDLMPDKEMTTKMAIGALVLLIFFG